MDDPDAMEAVGKVWVHWLSNMEHTNQHRYLIASQVQIQGQK